MARRYVGKCFQQSTGQVCVSEEEYILAGPAWKAAEALTETVNAQMKERRMPADYRPFIDVEVVPGWIARAMHFLRTFGTVPD